ncbi:hypothetical protein [Streptomyces cyaneofuscatus]|uniref:hypothetical protein n=1 Tax=Streptomyces cyaneofuscatus TaxID=66883 RepID=UPI003668A597
MKRIARSLMALFAAVASLSISTPASAAGQGSACYTAHVAGNGWDANWSCNGNVVGTWGKNKALEALGVSIGGVGRYCVNAHLRDYGWQGERCSDGIGAIHSVTVGTTGQNRPIEALEIWTEYGYIHGVAHVQDVGWMDEAHGRTIRLGVTGKALKMEAVGLWF